MRKLHVCMLLLPWQDRIGFKKAQSFLERFKEIIVLGKW